jgi:hypothetical protein
MKVSVALLEQRILATSQWRSNLIAKRESSDGCDKSIDDLIADADAYIQYLQRKIESINWSRKRLEVESAKKKWDTDERTSQAVVSANFRFCIRRFTK